VKAAAWRLAAAATERAGFGYLYARCEMKPALLAACLGLAVSACAEGYYGAGDYGYGGGYGGGRLAYYDDFYGPYYDGYWGGDGFYYYSLGRDRPFVRDDSRHFRRGGGDGFHGVRGRQDGQSPGRWGDRPHDRDRDHDHDHNRDHDWRGDRDSGQRR